MTRAPARVSRSKSDDELALEADRLEGFPHPRETEALLGHETAEASLRATFDSGRMHHGWLLTGLEGIGKATFAYALARYVLAKPEERGQAAPGRLALPVTTSSARQILAQSHPGLLVLRRVVGDNKRLATVIRVDEVRRLRPFLGHTAGEGAWRVVIVDAADELNVNAANALLKSLEEPPNRCLFLLIASEPGRLLPTIRSRCRQLDLAPLPPHALLEAARQASVAASEGGKPLPEAGDELMRLTALSRGSVRRLLTLWEAGGLALYERLAKLLASLPELDMAALHVLAEELSPAAAEQKFETFLGLLLDLLPRLVRAAAQGHAEIAGEAALARRIMPPESLATWAELWETIVRDKAAYAALNLDRRSLVLQTGFRMRDVARMGR